MSLQQLTAHDLVGAAAKAVLASLQESFGNVAFRSTLRNHKAY